jgi:hypothetical protein
MPISRASLRGLTTTCNGMPATYKLIGWCSSRSLSRPRLSDGWPAPEHAPRSTASKTCVKRGSPNTRFDAGVQNKFELARALRACLGHARKRGLRACLGHARKLETGTARKKTCVEEARCAPHRGRACARVHPWRTDFGAVAVESCRTMRSVAHCARERERGICINFLSRARGSPFPL